MSTVTIQIGNSDDKLTQREWSAFCQAVNEAVSSRCRKVYFNGGSHWRAPWQNACWVAEVDNDDRAPLKEALRNLRIAYRQESVAVTFGETQFI